jgi:hypothetical protein
MAIPLSSTSDSREPHVETARNPPTPRLASSLCELLRYKTEDTWLSHCYSSNTINPQAAQPDPGPAGQVATVFGLSALEIFELMVILQVCHACGAASNTSLGINTSMVITPSS